MQPAARYEAIYTNSSLPRISIGRRGLLLEDVAMQQRLNRASPLLRRSGGLVEINGEAASRDADQNVAYSRTKRAV